MFRVCVEWRSRVLMVKSNADRGLICHGDMERTPRCVVEHERWPRPAGKLPCVFGNAQTRRVRSRRGN